MRNPGNGLQSFTLMTFSAYPITLSSDFIGKSVGRMNIYFKGARFKKWLLIANNFLRCDQQSMMIKVVKSLW